ncbi:MAG: hypothetical protein V7L31_10720 [Nostoc sp.]|uniref:hypothetical protein n=1 Tax=Nostoc sp. TaxID=1180 RepID=UPI002FF045AC
MPLEKAQKVQKLQNYTLSSSQTPATSSQLAPRPFGIQAQNKLVVAKTQQDIESETFAGQKMEATKLELQAKFGTITPQGQERLDGLQANMNGLLLSKLKTAQQFGHNIANYSLRRPNEATPIQAKLTIGASGDKYEQQADETAYQVVQQIHQPQTNKLQPEKMSEDEDRLQMKPHTNNLQQEKMPREELQNKPMVQRVLDGNMTTPSDLEESINQTGVIDTNMKAELPDNSVDSLTSQEDAKEDSFNPELTAINQVGKIDPVEWLKEHPRPQDLKPFPDPRKRKKSNQTSEPDQNIISSQPGRTKGMDEFIKTLKNTETRKQYQELEQLTNENALEKAGTMPLGRGAFGTVYSYKKAGSSDADPVTHVIKEENDGGPGDRDYDERKSERKRAVFIPLVAHELGFTHMPLATSMPQSQVDRKNKRNNLLSTLAPGKAGDKKMSASPSSDAYDLVNEEFNKFVIEKTGKKTDVIKPKTKSELKKKFGFEEKLEKATQELTLEKFKELDIDKQKIQDAVILDMLFQYKDGSYTQYMFDQGNLKKIDNDDYGIAKVTRNQTGEYSSSFPVGLPNANKKLTDETKKCILNMDQEHLKKVLKAATYKDKSGNKPEKQQVFDEEKALRNLEDIQFLIREADKHGGISLRELFDLYNARDENELLDPKSSKNKVKEYELRIKGRTGEDKVLPSQLYNILGVDIPEGERTGLFTDDFGNHKELGKIDKERQQKLQDKRTQLGYAPSIKDNPQFIEAIEKRSNAVPLTENQKANQKANQLNNLKELNELINNLSSQLESFKNIVSLSQQQSVLLQINNPEQIEGSEHKFSQIKNWRTRKIKGKVRDEVREQIAKDKANKFNYLDKATKDASAIKHERIHDKAMYPVQLALLKKIIYEKNIALKKNTTKLDINIDKIWITIEKFKPLEDLEIVQDFLGEINAIGKRCSDAITELVNLEDQINTLIKQLESAVETILEHQEYPKAFGKDNIFEKDISSLKEAFEFYQKVSRKLKSPE